MNEDNFTAEMIVRPDSEGSLMNFSRILDLRTLKKAVEKELTGLEKNKIANKDRILEERWLIESLEKEIMELERRAIR